MQLDHFAVAVEQFGGHADLAIQPCEIGFTARQVAGDDAVAAAVEARAHAERHVHVQRQATRDRVAVAGLRCLAQLRLAEAGLELGRSWIGRVTRPRPVVAAEQVGIEGRTGEHAASLEQQGP